VLFGWKKSGKHNWYADRKQTTIWEFEKPKKNIDHPTKKPVALIAHPILNSSLSNCIVLDPFGGSGSTLIASEQTGRICYTIELDEKYCDVIVKRYIELAGGSVDVFLRRDDVEYSYNDMMKTDAEIM
jgi:DNA modification methylase